MHLVCVGVSHKTAALELRERLALDDEQAARFGRRLLDVESIVEAVALSTCNRTELYLFADDTLAAEQASLALLAEHAAMDVDGLRAVAYSLPGDAAIGHLFRVAAGLDSLVVGEDQIVAQLKNAYGLACGAGCTSTVFNRLFRQALETGKRVRSETTIGARPVSVSSAAVELARQVVGRLERCTVLVLGAGETSELTLRHLRARGVERVLLAGRTFATAAELAARHGGRAVPLDQLDDLLVEADIVISSTTASDHVVTRARVERAMRRRKGRPAFFIDIAVPRDVDPQVNRLGDVFLYDIDDLEEVVEAGRFEREREVERAERIVTQELSRMNEWLAGLEVVPTIARLRDSVEGIREAELERLASRLDDLAPTQRRQVEQLTASIVNKVLHEPTVRLKELAGERDAYVYVEALRRLFGLNGEADEAGDDACRPHDAGDPAAGAQDGEARVKGDRP